MPFRLALIDPHTADGAVKQTLDELAKRGPLAPMIRGMANSSALLRGDEQIADVVGVVALNILTGSFNLVAGIHSTIPARSAA